MKLFGILGLCLWCLFSSAQEPVQGNLWLSARTDDWRQSDQPASLHVQGNLESIQAYLQANGGTYKHTFRAFHSITLPAHRVPDLVSQTFVTRYYISSGQGQALIDTSAIQTGARAAHRGDHPLPTAYSGKGVVMGIIDSGMDLNHPDFQDSSGNTRVMVIWDQTRNQDTTRFPSYGYGEVYDSSDINSGGCPHTDPNAWNGHGTMVSGIAAGNGLSVPDTIADYHGYAYESPIILVATNFNAANWDQTVAEAVDFIYAQADSLGMPCVINASIGNYLGGHDGLDLPTLLIDSLVAAKEGRAFVCAAGNAGSVPPFHMHADLQNDSAFTWFQINPNSAFGSSVFMEAWADTADFDEITFGIGYTDTTTWTDSLYFLDTIYNRLDTLMTNSLGGNSQYLTWAEEINGRYLIQALIVNPTAGRYYGFVTFGTGKFDMWGASWMGISDMVYQNLPTSKQYLNIKFYHPPDTLQSIVSGWACSPNLITVGNYNNRYDFENIDGNRHVTVDFPVSGIGSSSSSGPTRHGLTKPDLAAPGNFTLTSGRLVDLNFLANTPAQRHRLAKGGYHFINGGTSMASPTVAGSAALFLEKCPMATMAQIKQAILATTYSDSHTGTLPNLQWGHGKLDAFQALLQSNFSPPISTSGGNGFCSGDSLTITISGTYPSLVWNTGDSGQSIVVHQRDTVFAIATDTAGCRGWSDTLEIDEYPLPVVQVSGDSAHCLGDSSVLYGQGAQHYLWTPGGTGDSLMVIDSGWYLLQGTDTLGCMNVDSFWVEQWSLPIVSISGDSAHCLGDSSVLYGGGAQQYLWSSGGTEDSIVAMDSGWYVLQGTDTLGCANVDSVWVDQWALPLVVIQGDTVLCEMDSAVLRVSGALTYLWNAGSNVDSLVIYAGGSYWVQGVDNNGCLAVDSIQVVEKNCANGQAENFVGRQVLIYPNPAHNELTIQLSEPVVSTASIQLLTLRGRVIKKDTMKQGQSVLRWELDEFAKGMYLILIQDHDSQQIFKLQMK